MLRAREHDLAAVACDGDDGERAPVHAGRRRIRRQIAGELEAGRAASGKPGLAAATSGRAMPVAAANVLSPTRISTPRMPSRASAQPLTTKRGPTTASLPGTIERALIDSGTGARRGGRALRRARPERPPS